MYKPIYCILHSNKNNGIIKALGITIDLGLSRSVIKEHSREYINEKFRWDDTLVYVNENGTIKYIVQQVSDFDRKYTGE